MKYDFTCPMCDTGLIVKDWRTRPLTQQRSPWCFCPGCLNKCYAQEVNETMNIYIVIITDTQYSLVQQQVDTLWNDWTDAAERVRVLNMLYEQDKDCDFHAHYYQESVQ